MRKIQKKANGFHMNCLNWLFQNCSIICTSCITFSSQKETVFV